MLSTLSGTFAEFAVITCLYTEIAFPLYFFLATNIFDLVSNLVHKNWCTMAAFVFCLVEIAAFVFCRGIVNKSMPFVGGGYRVTSLCLRHCSCTIMSFENCISRKVMFDLQNNTSLGLQSLKAFRSSFGENQADRK